MPPESFLYRKAGMAFAYPGRFILISCIVIDYLRGQLKGAWVVEILG